MCADRGEAYSLPQHTGSEYEADDCWPMMEQVDVEAAYATAKEDVEAFFEAVNATCQDEFREQIVPALRRRFESPPCSLLQRVLERGITDAEARRLLFTPTAADMQTYVSLLTGDPEDPNDMTDNAANKAQVLALTHLFLVHGRSWQHLRPFIVAGGFRPLVNLLIHPNRLLGSQAMHLLLLATHPDMYDWNKPPTAQQQLDTSSTADSVNNKDSSSSSPTSLQDDSQQQQQQHPAHGPDGALWLQLASLHDSPLLSSLMSLSPDVWPGSGSQAIQLMVFYLTWLRTWWSKDGVLQLSQSMLDGLSSWAARATASSIEQQLAAQLLEDFGKAGTAAAAVGGSDGSGYSSSREVDFEPQVELRVTADRTQVNAFCPGSEAARLKAAGNAAFKAKDWATAIQMYSAALDVPVPAAALIDEAPRRAVYHTNRAAAYLERVWQLQASTAAATAADSKTADDKSSSSSGWCEVGGLLDGVQLDSSAESVARQLDAAVMDCRAAIDLVPHHVKAHYRLATALKAKGNLKAAAAAAAAAQQYASSAADRAAAAKLAAAIQQQQAEEDSKPIVLTVKNKPHRNKNNFQPAAGTRGLGQRPVNAQSRGNPAAAAAAVGAADPLSQLLQEFEAAVCKAAQPAPIKLPTVGQSTADESEDVIETLRLPGDSAELQRARKCDNKSSSSALHLQARKEQRQGAQSAGGQHCQSAKHKSTTAGRKVVVEVLASSDDVETACDADEIGLDHDCGDRDLLVEVCNSSPKGISPVQDAGSGDGQQQQKRLCLDELLDVLD